MKTKLFSIAGILTWGFALRLAAQGYIVPNGVTYAGYSPIFMGYEVDVIQNPSNGDYTGFALSPQMITTFSFATYLDEGVRVFRVSSGDPVSLDPILAGTYPELTYPNNYSFEDGSTFYLGFYTGYNPWDSHGNYTGIYSDPVFGWGEFINNAGVIELLDSALEYGGGGIYAGTQEIIPVPEPSCFGLFLVGGYWFIRRRRSAVP
jgi:hypothetical protein